MPIPTIATGLSKLDREKLVRDCIRAIRGEGWTVRYDLEIDAWHVRQLGDDRIMGLTGLAFFAGRHDELQCRKCGCTEHEACVDDCSADESPVGDRGPCFWYEYDLCSHCHDPADRASPKDVCLCGDFRDQHDGNHGPCTMRNDAVHGFETCERFVLAERLAA